MSTYTTLNITRKDAISLIERGLFKIKLLAHNASDLELESSLLELWDNQTDYRDYNYDVVNEYEPGSAVNYPDHHNHFQL